MAGRLDAMLDTVFQVIPGWDVAGVVLAQGPARRQHLRGVRRRAGGFGGPQAHGTDLRAGGKHGGRWVCARPDGAETARLAALADDGTLRVEVAGTFGLNGVADAFQLSRSEMFQEN